MKPLKICNPLLQMIEIWERALTWWMRKSAHIVNGLNWWIASNYGIKFVFENFYLKKIKIFIWKINLDSFKVVETQLEGKYRFLKRLHWGFLYDYKVNMSQSCEAAAKNKNSRYYGDVGKIKRSHGCVTLCDV